MLEQYFDLSPETAALIRAVEKEISFDTIEKIAQVNQWKVLRAFQKNRVSAAHLSGTTGYGYDDIGRDTLDRVFADAFGAQDALVRPQIVSGTHALTIGLFGLLRKGDTLISATGKPYDTLEEVIGIRGEGNGSLKDFGVRYEQVELLADGSPDLAGIRAAARKGPKLMTLQRSCGYDWRSSLSVEKIAEIIGIIKGESPKTLVMVDNCYGEFAETREPCEVGADLMVGSLIKNPGGGLAPMGGYLAGTKEAVELCAYRLTCPGVGRECGASLETNRMLYQGFFMAPHVVKEALKGAKLAAAVFERLGFSVNPAPDAARTDIIQAIRFGSAEGLKAFCQGIQAGAPIDAFVTPEPWDMPGYENQVIMAAGAFVGGASIELSADAPMKEPYIAYMQGGLVYEQVKAGIAIAVENLRKKKLVSF